MPHLDRLEILERKAPAVDRETARRIFGQHFVVRARAAGAAMIELDLAVAPKIRHYLILTRNEARLGARVVRPQRSETVADRAIARRDGRWRVIGFHDNGTAVAARANHTGAVSAIALWRRKRFACRARRRRAPPTRGSGRRCRSRPSAACSAVARRTRAARA